MLVRCLPAAVAASAAVWLVLVLAQTAGAQTPPVQVSPDGSTVVLTRADCARLTMHQPSADATYRPGVDVHGRSVVPADIPGTPQIALPEQIVIDITVDLQARFGIPVTSSFYKPEARIGTVVVRPDGSAAFNGQPLTNQEQAMLAYLCQRQGPLGPR